MITQVKESLREARLFSLSFGGIEGVRLISNLKFIVDNNVGKLAKWLRMMGYDALYFGGHNDSQMVGTALAEGRVILTRDTQIVKRRVVISGQLKVILIASDDPEQQMHQVLHTLSLDPQLRPFTLCLECNQVLVEREPTPQVNRLLRRSLEYYRRKGINYWRRLIEEERKAGERFLAGDDLLSIITSFAPRGFNEICFIFNEVSSLAELDEGRITVFSSYLSRVLRAYGEMGIGSFNLATFSGPMGGSEAEFYWMSMKLISRPYPQGVYTSDTGAMERLQDVWVIDTLPEGLAQRMKSFLNE